LLYVSSKARPFAGVLFSIRFLTAWGHGVLDAALQIDRIRDLIEDLTLDARMDAFQFSQRVPADSNCPVLLPDALANAVALIRGECYLLQVRDGLFQDARKRLECADWA
jgi:hypothetical protein